MFIVNVYYVLIMRGKFMTGIAVALSIFAFLPASGKNPTISKLTPEEIAQENLKKKHVVIFAGEGEKAPSDSIADMIEMFYVDQFRSFQDPLSPCFMLMSKDARLAMGIGGMVRMRGWADYAGAVPANAFKPSLIPVPENPLYRKGFKGTPAGTGLFMRIIGRNVKGYNVQAYIFGQFSGYDNIDFKLKQAWVSINDWTIGYAPVTFSDVAAEPPMIDGGGANGATSTSAMLVRWLHDFGKHWQVAASLEVPQQSIATDNVSTANQTPWLPDLAGYGQIGFGHNQHVRLGAMMRILSYRDLISQTNHDILGWGLQLSGLVNILPNFTAFFTTNGGQGYQSHVADLVIGPYDLVADPKTDGKLYAPWTASANLGFKYYITQKWMASASAGQVRYFARNGVAGTEYKYGQYLNVNLYFNPTERVQAGIEWLIGDRHNFNHQEGVAHRIDFLFQFAF